MKKKYKNITDIVASQLCHNCGACFSICPKNAITLPIDTLRGVYSPTINKNLCNECGCCIDVCSGKGYDFSKIYREFFNQKPNDPWLGIYRKIITSNALDDSLRFNASSGGSLTALLICLLEEKIIDGAIVTKFDANYPLIPHTFIAKTKNDLLESIGSKYCPVPVNTVLKEILQVQGKFAFVGLPCHIQSLKLFQLRRTELKQKVPLVIGLMCSHNNTFKGTEFYLQEKGINISNINSFSYRGEGWLGSIKVHLNSHEFFKFPRSSNDKKADLTHAISFNYGFTIQRCLTCCDHMAEFADIVFGDPRFPKYIKEEKDGKSLVIIRTAIGEEAYQKAINGKRILNDLILTAENFYSGQNISFKKSYKTHIILNKILRRPNPKYNFDIEKKSSFKLRRIFLYLPSYFIRKKNRQSKGVYCYFVIMNTLFNPNFWIIRIKKLLR